MTTLQQERPAVVGTPSTRRSGLMIGMIVIGLLIGLLGGWLIFGSDDVITVDGSALTGRQIEMTELIDEHMVAWQANDAEGVVSHFTTSGVFVTDRDYRVSDGSLAALVRFATGTSMLESVGQKVVVDDTTVVSFHSDSGITYTNVFRFTTVGDVLITRHEVVR